MKSLVVFGAIAATLLAASIATDNSTHMEPKQYVSGDFDTIEARVSEPEVLRESDGIIYEYPSVEDANTLTDVPQDSIIHYIMFQEKPSGDVYSFK